MGCHETPHPNCKRRTRPGAGQCLGGAQSHRKHARGAAIQNAAPVQATAEAPESAAGKTLLFTYQEGAGIRSRDCAPDGKETPWPAWTKLVAATRGNYTFDAQNTHTATSGEAGPQNTAPP